MNSLMQLCGLLTRLIAYAGIHEHLLVRLRLVGRHDGITSHFEGEEHGVFHYAPAMVARIVAFKLYAAALLTVSRQSLMPSAGYGHATASALL